MVSYRALFDKAGGAVTIRIRDEIVPEDAVRVELQRLIRFYAYPGAHVVDPFAGSGTVGVAALRLADRFLAKCRRLVRHAR